MTTIFDFWWVFLIVISIVLYKFVLRVFFGMVIVPEDKIGLVTKKFVLFGADKSLPDSRIIATKGEAGYQAKTLAPGLYWAMWPCSLTDHCLAIVAGYSMDYDLILHDWSPASRNGRWIAETSVTGFGCL